MDDVYVQRGNALVFAQHTRQNLEISDDLLQANPDFHHVTHLVNSLLGLIVFLKEKQFDREIADLELDKLVQEGWPRIEMSGEKCATLGRLVYHLRNATAHGRMRYSSDSRDRKQVVVKVEDYKPNQLSPYWSASMDADQLRDFCLRFVALLENTIG
jgi:hypothetical protein